MYAYDLMLAGGLVVDPKNGVHAIRDIGLKDGKVVAVEPELSGEKAARIIDVTGMVLFPGVIDPHVHVGGRRGAGYQMTAAVGVTTLIDFGSSMDQFAPGLKVRGVGQTSGALYAINHDLSSRDAGRPEIEGLVDQALAAGSLGVKIVGGHYPLTPETTATIIDVANDRGVYIAFHLGTTETGSHIEGVRELPKLVGNNRLHVAHLNSYCRGMVEPAAQEALEALSIVDGMADQLVSESYLGTINGTGALCKDGQPTSHVTRNCLKMRGYEPTQEGLRQAIADGYCNVRVERGGVMVLVTGEEGVTLWEENDTDLPASFPVNSPQATFLCAISRNEDGEFIVDAISTDGGGNPRNLQVERGMALVRYGALTLDELATKISAAPADMYGLKAKGHLGEGADGDVTVIAPETGLARMAIAGGELIMMDGVVFGTGAHLLTTERGNAAAAKLGMPYTVVDFSQSRLYA